MYRKFKIKKRNISIQNLIILIYLLSVICNWSYGNSYMIYVLISVVFAIFSYKKFFMAVIINCSRLEFLVILLLCITFITSLLNGDIKSMIMVNISLLMPFAISNLHINFNNLSKQVAIASMVNLLLTIFISIDKSVYNSNSLAILIYCGISIGFIWFKVTNNLVSKISAVIYLFVSFVYLLATGSRNAGIMIIFCFILLLLPEYVMKRKWFFRSIYTVVMLATIGAADIMTYVFNNNDIMQRILKYTASFSGKAWGMDSHLTILLLVKDKFGDLSFLAQMLGLGIKTQHTHNLFYQCLFIYGILGTILIYGIYCCIFEIGYMLYKEKDNKLALACCIILLGHFMLQVGEVYMLGSEAALAIALLPAGIILQQKRNSVSKIGRDNIDII